MSLSGPDALRSIEEALRDVRREEDEIVRRLGRSAELVTKTRIQQGELLRQLAALRLTQPTRTTLVEEIAAAEAEASRMLGRHDAELAAMVARTAEIDAAIAKAGAERAALQLSAGERDGELRALAAKARPRLGKNTQYTAQLTAARDLAAAAEASLRRMQEADGEREVKERPYRDDPLFMYLWEKAYGTKAYRANPLVARLDAGIAGLIGYSRARANFVLIKELPLALRAHAAELRKRAEAAALDVARLESAAVDSAGGQAARQALEAAVTQIAALDATIAGLEDRRDEATRAQRSVAQGDDASYARVLAALNALLERADVRAIVAEARAAPKGQDPAILAQLDDLARRAGEESDESTGQRSRLHTLAARRRDLENLLFELKTEGFDNPHSGFADSDLVGDALNVFLRGEISLGGYWDRWGQGQTWDAAGYGGPGGGWGRLKRGPANGLGRTRMPPQPARSEALTSAA